MPTNNNPATNFLQIFIVANVENNGGYSKKLYVKDELIALKVTR
ncbi:hypothetical protein SAMN06297358_1074 [Pedobacter xixiisoli]|uniref:Uncharacterized protein n=1 Tax=Pedobacter xixiisoli TaxID=1476464 RepID=A0A285ZUA6_9SPHI|nr:hypothetical protein SAMN06297358_1074 [Pedobacter xixiisoli]